MGFNVEPSHNLIISRRAQSKEQRRTINGELRNHKKKCIVSSEAYAHAHTVLNVWVMDVSKFELVRR